MNFWNELIGTPIKGTVKTEISLHSYHYSDIIAFVKQGLVTRQEVIDSGVIEAYFGDELRNFIYPPEVEPPQDPTLVVDQ
jgi:hypothetical protein